DGRAIDGEHDAADRGWVNHGNVEVDRRAQGCVRHRTGDGDGGRRDGVGDLNIGALRARAATVARIGSDGVLAFGGEVHVAEEGAGAAGRYEAANRGAVEV